MWGEVKIEKYLWEKYEARNPDNVVIWLRDRFHDGVTDFTEALEFMYEVGYNDGASDHDPTFIP